MAKLPVEIKGLFDLRKRSIPRIRSAARARANSGQISDQIFALEKFK
jgi:hypothetical protein